MAQTAGKNLTKTLSRKIHLKPRRDYLEIIIECDVKKEDTKVVNASVSLLVDMEALDFSSMDNDAKNVLLELFSRGENAMWAEMERFAVE